MKTWMHILPAFIAASLFSGVAAHADLLVDFNDDDHGPTRTETGYQGVVWNSGSSTNPTAPTTPAINAPGVGSAITFTFSTNSTTVPVINARNRPGPTTTNLPDLGADFVYATGGTSTAASYLDVTINGIMAGTYDFLGYFHDIENSGGNATIDLMYSTDGTAPSVAGDTVSRSSGNTGTLATGSFVFTSNGTDPLTLRINSDVNGDLINGLEISAIPEPSAFLFGSLVCGILGFNACRRKSAA